MAVPVLSLPEILTTALASGAGVLTPIEEPPVSEIALKSYSLLIAGFVDATRTMSAFALRSISGNDIGVLVVFCSLMTGTAPELSTIQFAAVRPTLVQKVLISPEFLT